MTKRFGKAIKAGLCALVLAAAGLAIGLDAGPAQAVTTSVFMAVAVPDPQNPGQTICLSPPISAPSVVAIVGGGPITLCAWAKDVTEPRGMGAFNLGFTYDPSLLTVQSITAQTTWLYSTGLLGFCSTPEINPNPPTGLPYASVGCSTITSDTSYGPQGMGLIGTITIQPSTNPGLATLNFPALTFLYQVHNDTGTGVIQANIIGTNVRVAACADYNGDHTVRMNDITHIVQKYGTHDVPTDLDVSGTVLAPDIVIAVMEYGRNCPT